MLLTDPGARAAFQLAATLAEEEDGVVKGMLRGRGISWNPHFENKLVNTIKSVQDEIRLVFITAPHLSPQEAWRSNMAEKKMSERPGRFELLSRVIKSPGGDDRDSHMAAYLSRILYDEFTKLFLGEKTVSPGRRARPPRPVR